jgi:hypothetical protein
VPGRVVPAVAQVRGQLGLQRPFQHRPHQLAEHRSLAGQPQPPGRVLRPVQQRVQQPVIHQLPQRHPRRVLAAGTGASPVTERTSPAITAIAPLSGSEASCPAFPLVTDFTVILPPIRRVSPPATQLPLATPLHT